MDPRARMGWITLVLVLATRDAVRPAGAAPFPDGTWLDPALTPLEEGELSARARAAEFVLVGEAHANPCDHRAQAELVRLIGREGNGPAVGLEMVSVQFQPTLDLFNQGLMPLDRLERALFWEEAWGFAFALYRPVFEALAESRLPAVGLNAPREVARLAAQERWGSDELGASALLPEAIVPPPEGQMALLRAQYEQHHQGGAFEEPVAFERFVYAQSLWDTMMAQEALAARERLSRPVVVLAGAGHVEHGWGIAHRLRQLAPGTRVLSLLPWRGGEPPEPGAADLYFYCPP